MGHIAIGVTCQCLGVVTEITDDVRGGLSGGPAEAGRGRVWFVDVAPQVGASCHGIAQRVEGGAVGATSVLGWSGVVHGCRCHRLTISHIITMSIGYAGSDRRGATDGSGGRA